MADFDLSLIPEARELTDAEHQQWVSESHALDEKVRAGVSAMQEAAWRTAEALHRFKAVGGWNALGYETWGEWLEEVGLGRTTADDLVAGWEHLSCIRGVDSRTFGNLSPAKLAIALPALKAGTATTDEVISDVENLTARELREKYRARPLPPLIEMSGNAPADSRTFGNDPSNCRGNPFEDAVDERPTLSADPISPADPPSTSTTRACAPEIDDLDALLGAGRDLITADPDMTEVRRVADALREHATLDYLCSELIGLLAHFGALGDEGSDG